MEGGALGTAVVVDRWPLVRLGLAGVLSKSGIDAVGQASKVSEGLQLVRLRGVDLVVFGSPLDVLTPAAIRSAKHDHAPPKIAVLVPPSSAAGADVGALFAAGADALLVASVGPEELSEALARIGRGERVVGPELGPGRPNGAGGVGRTSSPRSAGQGISPPPADEGGGGLTAKELEVLALLAQGHSNKQIARALYVSDATIKTHLQHIYGKLDVQSRFGALSKATALGLLH